MSKQNETENKKDYVLIVSLMVGISLVTGGYLTRLLGH